MMANALAQEVHKKGAHEASSCNPDMATSSTYACNLIPFSARSASDQLSQSGL